MNGKHVLLMQGDGKAQKFPVRAFFSPRALPTSPEFHALLDSLTLTRRRQVLCYPREGVEGGQDPRSVCSVASSVCQPPAWSLAFVLIGSCQQPHRGEISILYIRKLRSREHTGILSCVLSACVIQSLWSTPPPPVGTSSTHSHTAEISALRTWATHHNALTRT